MQKASILLLFSLLVSVFGQNSSRILTVTGEASVQVQTTLAQVTLGVQTQAPTAELAQQELANISNDVIFVLQRANVSDLQTLFLSLSPQTDNNGTIFGFTASNILSFQVNITSAGAVIDSAIMSGATSVSGVTFFADQQALLDADQQAISQAVQSARTRAGAVLSDLGFSPLDVIQINIGGGSGISQPLSSQLTAVTSGTPILGGTQTITEMVSLTIRY